MKNLVVLLPVALLLVGCGKKEFEMPKMDPPGFFRVVNLSHDKVQVDIQGRVASNSVNPGEGSPFTTIPTKAKSIELRAVGAKQSDPPLASLPVTVQSKAHFSVIFNGKTGALVDPDLEVGKGNNFRFVTYDGSNVSPLATSLKIGGTQVSKGTADSMIPYGTFSIGGKDVVVEDRCIYLVIAAPNGKVIDVVKYKKAKPVAAGQAGA